MPPHILLDLTITSDDGSHQTHIVVEGDVDSEQADNLLEAAASTVSSVETDDTKKS